MLAMRSVIVGRIRLTTSPGIALIRGGAAGERRVLGEVAHVTRPGARRLTAKRAEYGIPQATAAQHAFARIDHAGLLHDRFVDIHRGGRGLRWPETPRLDQNHG